MMNRVAKWLTVSSMVLSMGAVSHAAVPGPRKSITHAKPELAAAAQKAVQKGFHAELPPHVSTLLGLTQEQKCTVMQGLLRSTEKIQGIDVSDENPRDVVIFVVDEAAGEQTYYLTSPSGGLRRILSVRHGVGQVLKPSPADLEAFRKEKKMWQERAVEKPAK